MDNRYPTTAFNSDDIAAKLDTPVFQEVISKRAGRGNTTLSYLRGDIIADQLNAIFGPLGWDLRAGVPSIDHWEGEKEVGYQNDKKVVNMHTVQVMTQMTLRIKARSADDSDTIFTQTGIGYGEIEATKNRKEVVGMALKGAETDGLKRCASLLGRAMGMFLTGTGSQDEIDYAHNGKNNDITKGKKMRAERLNGSGNSGGGSPRMLEDQSGGRQPSSGNRSGGNARQDDRRDDRGDDRQDNRQSSGRAQEQRQDARPAARQNDRQDERQDNRSTGSASNQRQERSEGKAAAPAKDSGRKPEGGQTKQDAGAGTEKGKGGFDLDRLPVTGDDQVEFSKEILARLDEFNQVSDKEKFLKTHYNTIKNLDSKYRRRLIERLGEQKIDFEALGAK